MKIINRHARAQYEEMRKQVEEAEPKPLTVKRHPEGKEPLTLKNGTIVMAGHYYSETQGIAIHPDDISDSGAWEQV
jgi:hypothetical protein